MMWSRHRIVLLVFWLGFVIMPAAAVVAVLMFFGAGTAPHKDGTHAQHDDYRKELRPSHARNIAANPKRANGILPGARRLAARVLDCGGKAGAATPLSGGRILSAKWKTLVRAKAAWRSA